MSAWSLRCGPVLGPGFPSPLAGEGLKVASWRLNLLPSPLAGEGLGERGPSAGTWACPPLPNPSPARGEGLKMHASPARGQGLKMIASPARGEGLKMHAFPARGKGLIQGEARA